MGHRIKQLEGEFDEIKSKERGKKLPPRSEIRREKKKEKRKLKYPLITILSLFFISLPVIAYFSYKHYASNQAAFLTVSKEVETGYEVVDFAEPSDKAPAREQSEKDEGENTIDEEQEKNDIDPQASLNDREAALEEESKGEEKADEHDAKGEYRIIQHKVQSNETLFSIAIQYYDDVKGTKLIRDWNKLENGKITEGQLLNIPIKEDELFN